MSKPLQNATGRRKTAIARVYITEGAGSITVNGGIVGQNAQQRESNANGEQAKLHAAAHDGY